MIRTTTNALLAATLTAGFCLAQGPAASSFSYGSTCNGSTATTVYAINDTTPMLRSVSSLPNEYAFPVINTSASPVQVIGFQTWTQSVSGSFETGVASIHEDAAGPGSTTHSAPAAAALSTGTIGVDGTAGWYDVAVGAPAILQPGEAFWVTIGCFSMISPPQAPAAGTSAPATIHYRRANLNSNAWTPSVSVTNPILRVRALSASPPAPSLIPNAPPALGQSMMLDFANGVPGAAAFILHSFNNTTWNGLPIPFDATGIGAPNCFIYTGSEVTQLTLLDPAGAATVSLPIPNDPSLSGIVLFNQGAAVGNPNAIGAFLTNATQSTVGM